MARSRNIKPGFFENEFLADTSPHARLLFIGLWCLADREGRLEDRPKRIKAALFPYENVNIDKLLNELATSDDRFIIRYQVDNNNYIQIPKFLKHQTPHVKENASTIPVPDLSDTRTSVKPPFPDSLNLIPDSLNPQSPSKKGELFSLFWKAYPKRIGKGAAEKAFNKICPSKELVDQMIAAIALQKTSEQWCKDGGQFIPHPATWLNGRRWEDEIKDTPQPVAKPEIPLLNISKLGVK